MEALTVLTSIAIVLLAGLVVTIISKRLQISNVLLLIALGIGLKTIAYNDAAVFDFSPTFLLSIAVLALVMITFDGSSRFKFKDIDQFSGDAMRIFLWFLLLNIILLTIFTSALIFPSFSMNFVLISLLFAVLMAATDPGAIFSMMRGKITKVIEVLEIESIINTPIIVIVPFLIINFLSASKSGQIVQSVMDQLLPFLQQIIVGVGAGVVVGVIIFKAMKKAYHEQLSPLAIIVAALLSYILAENLGGSGVLSVATMGLLFGNTFIKSKVRLQEFSSIFSTALEILVFVLIGFLVQVDLSWSFFFRSLALFGIMLIARWLAIAIALRKGKYKLREKVFMTLNMPKGIAVAAVVFSLSVMNIPELAVIIDLVLMFMIYSLILATIVDRHSKKLIKIKLED
ncbi:cation:proton antiporter [archaeon]|nr:cation:proton antiporter [archaeon]MBL7057056.1 cation:proton antiporter [Candidatus Woesearchaeota archaeon]